MKIARLLEPSGAVSHAIRHPSGAFTKAAGSLETGFKDTAIPVTGKLLAPVDPRITLCIGLNYRKHAEEGGKPIPELPVLFIKAPGTTNNPGDNIVLPRVLRSDMVDYECELAVVIGRTCKNVKKAEALSYVAGYTCGNDVSARDWQNKWGGGQWCRGKTFDTFAPLGPWLVTRMNWGIPTTSGS